VFLSIPDRSEIGIPRTGPNLREKALISEWPQPPFTNNAPGIELFTHFLIFFIYNIQRDHRNNFDAMCSMVNAVIHRAIHNYKKNINYLTFSCTTVSTSIRFPRTSLPRLVNLAHTGVLECCTKFSTRVLNLVPLVNLAPLNLVSLTWYSSTTTSTGGTAVGA
jgi:hypothetical protein